MRRFKAEVSNGIGSWLGRLENLSQLAIIINCASIYFTSHVYQGLFVKDEERSKRADGIVPVTDGWKLLKFFSVVVMVEHILLLLKLIIENVIEDVPEEVQKGGRERNAVAAGYKRIKDEEDILCGVSTFPERISAAREVIMAWKGRPEDDAPKAAKYLTEPAQPEEVPAVVAPSTAEPGPGSEPPDRGDKRRETARQAKMKRRAAKTLPPIKPEASKGTFQDEI